MGAPQGTAMGTFLPFENPHTISDSYAVRVPIYYKVGEPQIKCDISR